MDGLKSLVAGHPLLAGSPVNRSLPIGRWLTDPLSLIHGLG
jgi:hypothetical protein